MRGATHGGAVDESVGTGPQPRTYPADRTGVLGVENIVERGGARAVHQARGEAGHGGRSARRARAAPARRPRLLRRAGRARIPAARRRHLLEHAARPASSSTSGSPRTSAASSRWPTRACSASGTSSPRGCRAASRRTKRRAADGRRSSRLYAEPARLRSFLAGDVGHQPRREHDDRQESFPGGSTRPSSTPAPRKAIWPSRSPRANPHLTGTGLDLPVVQPIFEEYAAANGVARSRQVRRGRLLHQPAAEGRRRDDGPHPARLGSRAEEGARAQGLSRRCRQAARSSLTTRSSTMTGGRTRSG